MATVKQERRIIAWALFKGSQLNGSKLFMIKTSALVALHDEERFTQITNMSATVLSHYAVKWDSEKLIIKPFHNVECPHCNRLESEGAAEF